MTSEVSMLCDANIVALEQAISVLEQVDCDNYVRVMKPAFQASLGAHFRHLIEHYVCFSQQLQEGYFNYDLRDRSSEIEENKHAAITTMKQVVEELNALANNGIDSFAVFMDQQISAPIASSIERELVFLQAHTVHHFALIAAILRMQGSQVPSDFGVAISTLNFQLEEKRLSEGTLCAP